MHEAIELGLVTDAPMHSPYSHRWDKRPDYSKPEDWDWVGEDAQGVWLAVHPMSAYFQEPVLWDVVTDHRFGALEITERDREIRSNFELEALTVLSNAHRRQEVRDANEAREKAKHGRSTS